MLTVEPHHSSMRSDAIGKEVQDAHHTAADVDGRPARSDSDEVEEAVGLFGIHLSLVNEVLDLGRTVPEEISIRTGFRRHVDLLSGITSPDSTGLVGRRRVLPPGQGGGLTECRCHIVKVDSGELPAPRLFGD
jgi:hypothetical protein